MIWAHFTDRKSARKAAYFLDLVKFGDKSVVWSGKGPVWRRDPGPKCRPCSINGDDESFPHWVKLYSSRAQRFVIVDEKLRQLIESKLSIKCVNLEERVIREVVWGLRYALPFHIYEHVEKITIDRRCPLPLCQGLQDLMKKYEIMIPTKAVDRDVVTLASLLQHIEEQRLCHCTEMRKACDKLVPGISSMIKDNSRYVEVVAKILTPSLVESDPHKWSTAAGEPWFTADEMQKIMAKDAAADDARKKVEDDYELAAMIENNLCVYRRYPESEDFCLRELRYFEAEAKRGQKRSHTEMAEEEAVEAAEGRKGEDGADVTDAKTDVSSTRETPTSVIIEGLKNLPDRLATVMKNEAFNVVRDAFAVARSHYDSTDLSKICEGLAVAGDPHRPELEEITETVGPVAANLLKASDTG